MEMKLGVARKAIRDALEERPSVTDITDGAGAPANTQDECLGAKSTQFTFWAKVFGERHPQPLRIEYRIDSAFTVFDGLGNELFYGNYLNLAKWIATRIR